MINRASNRLLLATTARDITDQFSAAVLSSAKRGAFSQSRLGNTLYPSRWRLDMVNPQGPH